MTLPPDPVIEAYKKDIDRTLLRETLKLTPAQRLQRLQDFVQTMARLRGAVSRRCVTLPKLIALKRAAGRPRDFDAIAELEVLLEEQRRGESKAND